jgi:hypothetical protein
VPKGSSFREFLRRDRIPQIADSFASCHGRKQQLSWSLHIRHSAILAVIGIVHLRVFSLNAENS